MKLNNLIIYFIEGIYFYFYVLFLLIKGYFIYRFLDIYFILFILKIVLCLFKVFELFLKLCYLDNVIKF